jgi:uncharacterized delta-60 repeat protein
MSRSRILGVAAFAAITVGVAPGWTVDRAVGVQLRSSSHAGAQALAVEADGKLVAAGWTDAGGKFKRFALARYTSAGRLDASFGQGGKIMTDLSTGSDTSASDVAIQFDGKIVAAGSSLPWGRGSSSRAIGRTDGSIPRSGRAARS